MPDDTKAKADDTPDEAAKNTDKAKAEGDGTQTDKTADAPKFTQADVDRIAAQTRKDEQRKAKEAKEKEDREREQERAKEQGEFQKLAESKQKELDELKPLHEAAAAELEQYRSTVAELATKELRSLPEEVRELAPAQYGDDKALRNPLDVLAWLPKGKKLAEKLDGAPAKPGAGGDPKPKGGPGDAAGDRRAAAQASRPYRSL
jgi:hypothetical protein